MRGEVTIVHWLEMHYESCSAVQRTGIVQNGGHDVDITSAQDYLQFGAFVESINQGLQNAVNAFDKAMQIWVFVKHQHKRFVGRSAEKLF